MSSRGFFVLLFGGLAIALSACGGGSGSTSAPLPSSPQTTSAPTATPTPGSPITLSPGQSFAYAGTLLQTDLRVYPAPMPTATTMVTVTQSGVLKDQQTFNGKSGLYDASVSETDTTPLQSSKSQTDAYVGFSSPAPDGSASLLEYGSSWADDNGNTLGYTYPTPLVLAHLPEKSGDSWSNGAAVTILENDSSDTSGSAFFSKQIIAADGSYTETTDYPANYGPPAGSSTITQRADGSGSITNVVGAGALVFGTPQPQSNGQYELPFSVYAVPSPGPSDAPIATGAMGAWYGVPAMLFHETDTVALSQPLPPGCTVPASVATTASLTQRTITRLDSILGYTETQTTNEYRVPSLGAVCVQMNDTRKQYYDYNGDSQYILSPTSDPTYVLTPIEITTTSETLGLSGGVSPQSGRRRASVVPLSPAAIGAAQMRFNQTIERQRMLEKLRFVRSLKSFIQKRQGAVR